VSTSSSFYTDGEAYTEVVAESPDVISPSTPSQAPSSFYPDGGAYSEADPTIVQDYASQAAASAAAAAASAADADTSEASAVASAAAAASSASSASSSATAADASEAAALAAQTNAASSASNAAASAAAALTSANNAASSETAAANSASNAATSASNAATSETNADTSEANAAASASAAATSASNAATSETNADASEAAAAASASTASTQAGNAATSATAAAGSATTASTQASNAAASASAAATSETNAASSASTASTAATNAQASYDSFRGVYYGALASDPTLDPLGNAPGAGDFYFNTTSDVFRAYDGSTWADMVGGGGGSASVTISDTPPGSPTAGNLWWESDSGNMYIYYDDGTTSQWVPATGLGSVSSVPKGHIHGLAISVSGTTLSVAVGEASDATAVSKMVLASTYSKTTSAWAVGSGNGGLDTGTIANTTWYHVFLIKRLDTGVVDVLYSTSLSPTMPANYTVKRRIGSRYYGAGSWAAVTQIGELVLWNTPALSVNGDTTITNTPVLRAVATPTGVVTEAYLIAAVSGSAANAAMLVSDPAVNQNDSMIAAYHTAFANTATHYGFTETRVTTNSSAQVHVSSNVGGNAVYVLTRGWTDWRGRFD
jgi:hypothetical protein